MAAEERAAGAGSPPWFETLRLQYLGMRPIKSLDRAGLVRALEACGDDEWASEAVQAVLVSEVVACRHAQRYPGSAAYRARFLKWCVAAIEGCAHAVIDALYDRLMGAMAEGQPGGGAGPPAGTDGAPLAGHCWKSYAVAPGTLVPLVESEQLLSQGTTGLSTWPAAICLAEWSLASGPLLRGKRVVELGAGAGLVGLSVARRCAPASVVLTDYHHSVLRVLRRNVAETVRLLALDHEQTLPPGDRYPEPSAARSEPAAAATPGTARVTAAQLDWQGFTRAEALALQADVVLAADVVFDSAIVPALVGALDAFLQARGADTRVVVASTVRNEATLALFLDTLAARGVAATPLGLPDPVPSLFADRSWQVVLHELTQRPTSDGG